MFIFGCTVSLRLTCVETQSLKNSHTVNELISHLVGIKVRPKIPLGGSDIASQTLHFILSAVNFDSNMKLFPPRALKAGLIMNSGV